MTEAKMINVWLGTSVSTQAEADRAIPHLLRCPAAIRFLFCVLLEELDLSEFLPHDENECCPDCGGEVGCNADGTWTCIAIHGIEMGCGWTGEDPDVAPHIDWVIVGGESGPNARLCRVEWIRSIVRQCKEAGVSCFVKQLGSNPYLDDPEVGQPIYIGPGSGGIKHPEGADPAEWPEDLRVREFPEEENR